MALAPSPSETYEFPSGVALRVHSHQAEVLAHFRAEYAGAVVSQRNEPVDIEVYAGREAVRSGPLPQLLEDGYEARHKILRWRVGLAGLDEQTTVVAFDGSGQMVISFLQTFYVEPLLRPKFAARDHALVHAACLAKNGESVLFPAGSRVGKSTMTLQHAAAGLPVQGDNYVILSSDGRTLAFPRRMRIYSDLPATAPEVFRRLPSAEQRRLKVAGIIKKLSAGYSNQPRRLTVQQMLPDSPVCAEARLRSVFLLKPYEGEGLAGPSPCSSDAAIARIQEINSLEAKQLGEALSALPAPQHAYMTDEMTAREKDVLSRALKDVAVSELLVPRVKDPAPVVAEMRRLAGLDGAG
jgi:hypothetical protein